MNDIIGEDYEIDDVMIEQLDLYDQSIAERTVEEVIDVDSGEILQADDIFSQDESVIISIRKALELAHKSDIYKYICPYCQQEVRISHKRVFSRNSTTYFFSHYPNSDDCPIKSENTKSLVEILENRQLSTKESEVHKQLVSFISQKLESDVSKSKGFFDVKKYAIFKDNNISNEWRKPDITVMFGSKKVVFELQLLHTFLGDMTERDSFYRLHNTHIIWIFKSFSPQNQKMVEKDLYHAHKRNVFVLDQEAYYKEKDKPFNKDSYVYSQVESERRNELILRCYWQKPVIDENNKVKIDWHHKLVSIDELTFDEKTNQVYYYNSDKDFYQQIDPEKQKLIDLWEAEKEKRWKKIFDSFKQRQERKRDWQDKKEEREAKYAEKLKYIQLLSKIKNGEIELQSYQKSDGLFGFTAFDEDLFEKPVVIIKAKYKEVQPFRNGIAFVKQANWGAVNIVGKKVISFQYLSLSWIKDSELIIAKNKKKLSGIIDENSIEVISFIYEKIGTFENGIAKAMQKRRWGIIDENGKEIIPFFYDEINPFIDEKAIAKRNDKWGQIDINGNEVISFEYDDIQNFILGKAFAKKNQKWGCIDERGNEVISFNYDKIENFEKGIAKAMKNCLWGIIDENGNEKIPFVYEKIGNIENCLIKAQKELKCGWGCIDKNGNEVVRFIYDYIGDFVNGKAKVSKHPNIGYIDIKGNEVIPLIFQEITDFQSGLAKVKKNNLYGCIDESGNHVIPIVYQEIDNFIDGVAKARRNNVIGYIDENGVEIFQNITEINKNLFKCEKFGLWGMINANSEIILPFEYEEIGDFVEGKAKAIKNKRSGVINIDGVEMTTNLIELGQGLFKLEKFGNWGLGNSDGEIIYPYEYQDIIAMNNAIILFSNQNFEKKQINHINAQLVEAEIVKIENFGILLEYSGVKGLLENIELNRVGKTTNYYAQQKTINVYVKHADDIKQRMLFSIIHPSDNPNVYFLKKHNKLGVNSKQIGTISRIENYGLFVRIKGIGTAMLHISELKKHGKNIFDYKINDEIEVKILNVDKEKNRVSLTL